MCDVAAPSYMDDLAIWVETDMATSLLPAIQAVGAIIHGAGQLHRWKN